MKSPQTKFNIKKIKKLGLAFLLVSALGISAQNDSIKFDDQEVQLSTSTGTLFGSLMKAKADHGKQPIVLIIAGSGPTDRNCNNPTMTSDAYKKLAKALSEHHISSVRYDKRGIAASRAAGKEEKDLRFEDMVNDAAKWIEWIKASGEYSEIIVAGHSEGSLIGMLVSNKNVSKFISIAGISQKADEVLKEQLKMLPEPLKSESYAAIDTLAGGKMVLNYPKQMASLFRPSVQPYVISWFKYDPMKVLAELKIPILVLQGTNDIQVKTEEGKNLASANKHTKLVLVEGMNHVLTIVGESRKENMDSYNQPEKPLAPLLIESTLNFIQNK